MSIERIGFSFLFISLILFFLMKYSDTRTVKFFEKLETHHIAFILLAIIIISNITILFFTQTTKIITVKEKYIRAGRYSTFRIVDTNDESYELSDNILLMEFNSADDYAKMQVNQTYKVYAYSFRLPFLSMFPKIYKFEILHLCMLLILTIHILLHMLP